MQVTDEEMCGRLRVLSFPQTNVFLLCFAIDDRKSFDLITTKWVPEVRGFSKDIPIVLVGLRGDRRDDDASAVQQAIAMGNALLTKEDGEKLAQQIGAVRYMECSARGDPTTVDVVVNAAIGIAFAHLVSLQEKKKTKKCQVM